MRMAISVPLMRMAISSRSHSLCKAYLSVILAAPAFPSLTHTSHPCPCRPHCECTEYSLSFSGMDTCFRNANAFLRARFFFLSDVCISGMSCAFFMQTLCRLYADSMNVQVHTHIHTVTHVCARAHTHTHTHTPHHTNEHTHAHIHTHTITLSPVHTHMCII